MGDVSINYEDHVEHVEGIMFVYKLNIIGIYHGIIYIYIYIFAHQYHGNIMFVGYISQDLPMISPSGCRRVRGASAVSLNTWNVRWAARHPWILALVVDEIRDSTIQNDGHLGA